MGFGFIFDCICASKKLDDFGAQRFLFIPVKSYKVMWSVDRPERRRFVVLLMESVHRGRFGPYSKDWGARDAQQCHFDKS